MTRHLSKQCRTCGTEADGDGSGQCSVCFGVIWKFKCNRHNMEVDSEGCKQCAYTFLGEHFHTPATLAVALSGAWEAGTLHVIHRPLHEWIRDTFDDKQLVGHLKKVFRSEKLNPDQSLAISLILLDSARPFVWRGDSVTADWLLGHPHDVETLLEGELPIWLHQLRREKWLVLLHARWQEFWNRAGKNVDLFDRALVLEFLLGPNEKVSTTVSKRLDEFSESSIAIIQTLLEKTALDEIDGVMLASCNLKCLRSRIEVRARLVTHYIETITALIADEIPKQTTLAGLEQSRRRLHAYSEHLRNELARLPRTNLPSGVEGSMTEVETKAEAALDERLASHERQRLLRERLLKLAAAGGIREAERLAGEWKTEFTDLELGMFYQLRQRWRWLVQANRLAWGALVFVLVVTIIMKWSQMQHLRPVDVNLAQGVSLRFIPLPLGAFDIGSSTNEEDSESSERPVTTVRLTRQLWLTETEITQAQWQALMETNVEQQRRKHKLEEQPVEQGPTLPIVFVSWSEAEDFSRKVARRLHQGGTVRLPTEAEWEIACRAGANARLFPSSRLAPSGGNFGPNRPGALGRALPVKQFPANGWGFYDMHGNVGEWCRGGAVVYPGGEVEHWYANETESERAYRGGSWKLPIQLARSSARNWRPGGAPTDHVGFRVLWELHAPPNGD